MASHPLQQTRKEGNKEVNMRVVLNRRGPWRRGPQWSQSLWEKICMFPNWASVWASPDWSLVYRWAHQSMAKFMISVAGKGDLIFWKARPWVISKGWEGIHPLSDACVCRQPPRLEDILLLLFSRSVVSDSLRLSSSSVHGISQARILEWVAISFSRGSSRHLGS